MYKPRAKTWKIGVIPFLLFFIVGCPGGYTSYEAQHPLSDKVGFSTSGKLKDGTRVSYEIKRKSHLSFHPVEQVMYKKNGTNIIADYDGDGKVDRILIGKSNEVVGREFFGMRLRYNESILSEAEAREIIHDADRIFNRVKVALDVDEKLESYEKKVKNPFR